MKSFLMLAVILALRADAQSLLSGTASNLPLRLLTSDSAVLDLGEPKRDLPCTVSVIKPQLEFDFMFHTGYRVSLPLRELAGPENLLTMVFRVTAATGGSEPAYFTQKIRVPAIASDQGGDAAFEGAFLVGRGKYQVDWLMRDRDERFCTNFWNVTARLNPKDTLLAQAVLQDVVKPMPPDPFVDEPATDPAWAGRRLSVQVLVNFAPRHPAGAIIAPDELRDVSGILRQINREPSIERYTFVACSLQPYKVIHRQQGVRQIDLPDLGRAVSTVELGRVSVDQLAMKDGASSFVAEVILEDFERERPDAIILISPKSDVELKLPREVLNRLQGCPVFYLNYGHNRDPFYFVDTFGTAVRQLRGFAYTISQPRDLVIAWSDIVSRLGRAARP
jgi:hypothetical protein